MIVLSEATLESGGSASAQDNADITEAAKLLGCTVYYIPKDFSQCETAENALWHIPEQEHETPGIWIGFIPAYERYEAIYNEALRKRIRLVNSPEQQDIGQMVSDDWIVIEVNDARFAGPCQVPPIRLWNAILRLEET